MKRNLKSRIDDVKQRIEKAGGRMMVSADMPDTLIEQFLAALEDCPECAEAIDREPKPRRTDH